MSVKLDKKASWLAKIAIMVLATARWSDGVLVPALTAIYNDLPTDSAFLQTFIVTGPSLVAIPVTLIFGKLADYVSKKRLLIVCVIMCIIGGAGGAFAQDMVQMAILRAIVGVGTTVSSMLIYSIMGELFEGEERGQAMGLYQAFSTGYGTVITAVAGIIAVTSWRNAFLLNAIAIIELVLIVLFIPDTPAEGKAREEAAASDEAADEAPYPYAKIALIILGMMGFSALAFAGYYSVDPYVQARGLGTSAISGFLGSAYTIGSAVGALFCAKVYAKIGRPTPIAMFALAGLGFVALGLNAPTAAVLVIMFLTGIACGMSTVYFAMRYAELAPASKLTKTMSVQTVCLFGALYFCGMIPGVLGSIFNVPEVAGQFMLIGICLLVLGAAAIFVTAYTKPGIAVEDAE